MSKKHLTQSLPASQSALSEAPESPEDALDHRRAKNEAAIRLLDLWSQGDEQEQRETWECLKRALDENRLSNRKLFP